MIGIVVPAKTLSFEKRRLHAPDSILNQYKALAKKYKVNLGIFSFRGIRQNTGTVEALVFSHKNDTVLREIIKVPQVSIVYNTNYIQDQGLTNKIEGLRNRNMLFINLPLYKQANKLRNCEFLSSINQFKSHIPHTKRLSFEHLQLFFQHYDKVVIKPIHGSKGRRITIIEKEEDQYRIYQTSSRKYAWNSSGFDSNQKTMSIPLSQLEHFYTRSFNRPDSFLVQQWIPFQTFNGRPFDLRAVVQKNGKNRWQVTSCVARVANEKRQITNLSQGGEMVSLSKLKLAQNRQAIRQFCLEIAQAFAKLYPWTADMGIDLALDAGGKLWYIETNYCPEKVKWSSIYKIPFKYAYYVYKTSH